MDRRDVFARIGDVGARTRGGEFAGAGEIGVRNTCLPVAPGVGDRHAEGRRALRDRLADAAQAHDAHARAGHLAGQRQVALDRPAALRSAVEALLDASEDDVATGGPNPVRHIYPIVLTVTASGADEMDESEVAAAVDVVLEERR